MPDTAFKRCVDHSVVRWTKTEPFRCLQDAPEKMADTLLGFWERNDRTGLDVLRGVKKVGEV